MATSIGQYAPVFLPGGLPPWQRSLAGHSLQGHKESVRMKWPCAQKTQPFFFFFFCLLQLCPSESWVWRWCSCLACRNPGGANCSETQTASVVGVMALSESFHWASCRWRSEGLFGQSFSVALPIRAGRGLPCLWVLLCRSAHQALTGAPWVGSCSVAQWVRRLMGWPLYCSAAMLACGERLWWWLHPLRVTQQHCLASMAAWLSSTGISHDDLLPHVTSICLSAVSCSPCPGFASQSLDSSSQLLPLPGDPCACPAYACLRQRLSDSHSI